MRPPLRPPPPPFHTTNGRTLTCVHGRNQSGSLRSADSPRICKQHAQSESLARNISGTDMSSWNWDFWRSALGPAVSAARALSAGTGGPPWKLGGGRERLLAVRCSAVWRSANYKRHVALRDTYPGGVAETTVVGGHVGLAADDIEVRAWGQLLGSDRFS